jgi:hypothetical protein
LHIRIFEFWCCCYRFLNSKLFYQKQRLDLDSTWKIEWDRLFICLISWQEATLATGPPCRSPWVRRRRWRSSSSAQITPGLFDEARARTVQIISSFLNSDRVMDLVAGNASDSVNLQRQPHQIPMIDSDLIWRVVSCWLLSQQIQHIRACGALIWPIHAQHRIIFCLTSLLLFESSVDWAFGPRIAIRTILCLPWLAYIKLSVLGPFIV